MRFFHTADIHLGASPDRGFPWAKERKSEIWESFRRLIQRAESEQTDLLLIAGDLFHRQPLLRELKEVNYLFSTLTRTKVVFIIGNHDYRKHDSYYRGFVWHENVICLAEESCQRVVFPDLGTAVYGLSYQSREVREPLYDHLIPKSDGLYSILLAHGGDEKHSPINQRKLLHSGFDYIALGHIHKPQILVKNQMAYAGALEPLDKNDLGSHGFIAGSYEKGVTRTEFVPWAAREYIDLNLLIEERDTDFSVEERIGRMIQESGAENIFRIHLEGFRDPDILFHTETYMNLGNIVEAVDNTQPAYDFEKLKNQHHEDVIGAYIEKLYRPDMNELQRKALYYGVSAMLGVNR